MTIHVTFGSSALDVNQLELGGNELLLGGVHHRKKEVSRAAPRLHSSPLPIYYVSKQERDDESHHTNPNAAQQPPLLCRLVSGRVRAHAGGCAHPPRPCRSMADHPARHGLCGAGNPWLRAGRARQTALADIQLLCIDGTAWRRAVRP